VLISVLIPAYNAAQFIDRSIESVLNQTHRDIELIVVDDASTDHTATIVRRWAESDSRIRLIQNSRNAGISVSANVGTEAARSQWIARLDADDIMLPTRLERQLRAAVDDPKVVAWGTYAFQINRDGVRVGTIEIGPTSIAEYNRLLETGSIIFVLNSTMLYRRKVVLEAGGFHTIFDSAEDVEMVSRIQRRGPIQVIPEHLVFYRIHADSITTKKADFQSRVLGFVKSRNRAWLVGSDLTFEEYLSDRARRPLLRRIRDDAAERARLYYRRAGVEFIEGRRTAALLDLGRAAVRDPRFIAQRLSERARRRGRHAAPS
jgi:glycosyltransferase involved in cell wall biosynthesis